MRRAQKIANMMPMMLGPGSRGMMPGQMPFGHGPLFAHGQQMHQALPARKVKQVPFGVQQMVVQNMPVQPKGGGAPQAGVGLYFKMDTLGRYYVEMVLSNSSAEATGVVAKGDILEVVDEKSTQGVSLPQLRDMILGTSGSYVNLSFLREKGGEGFRYDIDLIRGDPNKLATADLEVEQFDMKMGSQKSVTSLGNAAPMIARTAVPKPQTPEPRAAPRVAYGVVSASSPTHDASELYGESMRNAAESSAEAESYKKRYLAEQTMHLEAERELQNQREQISSLQKMVAQLQAKAAVDAGPVDSSRALAAGFVPKQDLVSAMNRNKALEQELQEAKSRSTAAPAGAGGDSVPRAQYQALERKATELEEEVRRQLSIVKSHQTGSGNDQIQRMCVVALPAAVSALHSLSEESGHASSATWALVRAQDYVAHLASSRYPLSIPGLVTCIAKGSTPQAVAPQERSRLLVDTQDACLAMSVISWDPEGRNMLLRDSRTVPALLGILGLARGSLPVDTTNEKELEALNIPPQAICARFAAMTLGNFSLDEGGRMSIMRESEAMSVLVDAIAGEDRDTAQFALLCAGNVFMLPDARQKLLEIGGAVDTLFDKLTSTEVMTIRFAAGAVRNFAADDSCREAITKVKGSISLLQELSRNMNPRIRDHAEHALFNMRMMRVGSPPGFSSSQNTLLHDNSEALSMRSSARSVGGGASDRSAFENIGANLFGMA